MYKYVEDGSDGQMTILSGRDPGRILADIGTVNAQGQTCDITLQGKFENGRGQLQNVTKQCGVELQVEPSGAALLSVVDGLADGCRVHCGMNAKFLGNYSKFH